MEQNKAGRLSPVERVKLARSSLRPGTEDYIKNIIEDYIPMAGDRCYGDDLSVTGGIGFFHGIPVTVIGHVKGHDLDENMKHRFGMPDPEGYRKASRLMLQAAKFGRPVITFVDTPGAYPGKEAEERGQGQAIAECIKTMSRLSVPTISVFTGEGGSGGALAFAVSDRLIMMENSIFSILSPEGFASILWHDSDRWQEACEKMKLTAADLNEMGICDEIVPEPSFEMEGSYAVMFRRIDEAIIKNLKPLLKTDGEELIKRRYLKLRKTGSKYGRN